MPCRKPFLLLCNTVAFPFPPPSFPPSNGFFGPSTSSSSSSGEEGSRKNCARIGKNPSLTSDSILFLSRTSFEDIFFAEKKKGTSISWKSFAPPILLRMDDEKKKTKKNKDNTWREKETKNNVRKSSLLRAFSRSVVQSLFLSPNKSGV